MESTVGAPVCYSVKRHAQLEQLVASNTELLALMRERFLRGDDG